MAKRQLIKLKRVYEAPTKSDGTRILVERLWPRGLSKDKAAVDHWQKDIAPSPGLRKWYSHDPKKWPEFQKRYRKELDQNAEVFQELKELCAAGPATFVYAARDEERNGALVLKAYIEKAN